MGWESFQQRVAEGEVTATTLVWHDGMGPWQSFQQVTQDPVYLQEAGADGGTAKLFCSRCGRLKAQEDLIEYNNARVCGTCKDPFFQAVKQGTVGQEPTLQLHYAGFWTRFGAKIIDGLLTSAVFMVGNVAIFDHQPPVLWIVLSYLVPLAYSVLMHGTYGATLGKMAIGVKVVRPDGTPITYLRALGRALAEYLSSILLIGYIIAGFDEQKRALHDYIAGTRVVYKHSLLGQV